MAAKRSGLISFVLYLNFMVNAGQDVANTPDYLLNNGSDETFNLFSADFEASKSVVETTSIVPNVTTEDDQGNAEILATNDEDQESNSYENVSLSIGQTVTNVSFRF